MATLLTLDDVRRAWDARDPELVKYIEVLTDQPDPQPATPIRQGALTFQKFLNEIHRSSFRTKPDEDQMRYRIETMKALEAPSAEVPLPDRLKLHAILLTLWQDNSPFARRCLLGVIATVRLRYGPWRALKRIFKEAECRDDTEVFGALAARFDAALSGGNFQPSRLTMAYLARRSWRYYRRLAKRLPAVYAFRYFPLEGGLMSYGTEQVDVFRQAASYVDRILRGAKPAELPVQAPTNYRTVVNLKTAKALGLNVPPSLLVRADEVIE